MNRMPIKPKIFMPQLMSNYETRNMKAKQVAHAHNQEHQYN